MKRSALTAALWLATAAAAFAAPANERRMTQICEGYASSRLGALYTTLVDARYAGAGADGTHVVTGEIRARPRTAFRCVLDASGRRIVEFTHRPSDG